MTRCRVAIVNPVAGGRPSPRALEVMLARLAECADRVLVTSGPGDAARFARESADADSVMIAGGDGTLFDVLQQIDRPRQIVAPLPAGRGNALAREVNLRSVDAALAAVRGGATQRIDLLGVSLCFADGRVWTGVSASNVAAGYPAAAAKLAADRFRRWGQHGYSAAAIMAPIRRFIARVAFDDGAWEERRMTGIGVSNTRYVGPFEAFPAAIATDGRLDVMTIAASRPAQLAHNLSALTRLHLYTPAIVRTGTRVAIEFDQPALIQIDGELREDVAAMTITIEPGALTCVAPPRD